MSEVVFEVLAVSLTSTAFLQLLYELISRKKKNRLDDLADKLGLAKELIDAKVNSTLKSEDENKRISLVKLTLQIEDALRRVARIQRKDPTSFSHSTEGMQAKELVKDLILVGVIDRDLAAALQTLWALRNRIVHEGGVASGEVQSGLRLAAAVLLRLDSLIERSDHKDVE